MKKIFGIILGIIIAVSCQGCGMSGNNDKVITDNETGLDIVEMISFKEVSFVLSKANM